MFKLRAPNIDLFMQLYRFPGLLMFDGWIVLLRIIPIANFVGLRLDELLVLVVPSSSRESSLEDF